MDVLVTGGTGFIGRHIVWRLAARGDRVIYTGRNAHAAKLITERSGGHPEFHFVDHGSTESEQTIRDLSRRVDAVVNCASLSAPWGPRAEFERCNITSTREVHSAVRDARVTRLVHLSSPSIYCEPRDKLNIKENDPLPPPMTDYAATKVAAEELLGADPPCPTAILRPRAVFGPWDTVLLPRLLRAAAAGPLPLVRGGNALLDLTYVDNLVDAVELALTAKLPEPVEAFNVTNEEPIRFRDLAAAIASVFSMPIRTRNVPYSLVYTAALGLELKARLISLFTRAREPKMTRYGAAVVSFSQTLDISKAKSILGYQPRVSFHEGLSRQALWYRTEAGRREDATP